MSTAMSEWSETTAASSPAAEPTSTAVTSPAIAATVRNFCQRPPDPLQVQPLRRRDAEQVAGQFGSVLKVVVAQPRDPACVAEVLDP